MRSNSKHTTEEIERYILMYLNEGISGIQVKSKYNKYSKEFKVSVVKEHLEDKLSIGFLAVKYNIPKADTVKSWINKYTKRKETRSYSPKSEVYTMKDKKSTQEEKIKIAQDCLANVFSYKKTADWIKTEVRP